MIEAASKELGTHFPSSYREFLQRWGWAECGVASILGLGMPKAEQYRLDCVYHTKRMRENWNAHGLAPWPATGVIVYDVGNGDFIYMVGEGTGEHSGCIFEYNHEFNEHDIAAASFTQWLEAILTDPDCIPPQGNFFGHRSFLHSPRTAVPHLASPLHSTVDRKHDQQQDA